MNPSQSRWFWPLFAAFFRWPLIALGTAVVMIIYRAPSLTAGLLVATIWSALVVTIVNVVTFGFLMWRARVESFRFREMIGFQRERLWRDIGQGLLLSLGLYALLTAGVMLTALLIMLLAGKTLPEQFAPTGVMPEVSLPTWLALFMSLGFTIFNPLIEELNYRGYAQSRLIALTGRAGTGILIVSLGFGLQHMAFAFTVYAMPAFVVGFLFWSIGAGYVVYRQKRLMPLIVAHFISNAAFGIFPLLYGS